MVGKLYEKYVYKFMIYYLMFLAPSAASCRRFLRMIKTGPNELIPVISLCLHIHWINVFFLHFFVTYELL